MPEPFAKFAFNLEAAVAEQVALLLAGHRAQALRVPAQRGGCYLQDVNLRFGESQGERRFMLDNHNVQRTRGCGPSFSLGV